MNSAHFILMNGDGSRGEEILSGSHKINLGWLPSKGEFFTLDGSKYKVLDRLFDMNVTNGGYGDCTHIKVELQVRAVVEGGNI